MAIADPATNGARIAELARSADADHVALLVTPELSMTGYTCEDLFATADLHTRTERAIADLATATADLDVAIVIGAPVHDPAGRRYNAALVLHRGEVLAAVPKTHLPGAGEFYEYRWFTPAAGVDTVAVSRHGSGFGPVRLCARQLVRIGEALVGIEICEDLWAPEPPSGALALAGATVIVNPSASNELVAKADYRRELVRQQSARLHAVYVYAGAGPTESTKDIVFGWPLHGRRERRDPLRERPLLVDGFVDDGRRRPRAHARGAGAQPDVVDEHVDAPARRHTGTGRRAPAAPLAAPLRRAPSDRPRRSRDGRRPRRGDPGDPVHRARPAAPRRPLREGRHRRVRRPRLDTRAPRHRRGHAAPGPPGERHRRHHDARHGHDGSDEGSGRRADGPPRRHRPHHPIGPAVAQHFADIGHDPADHSVVYENSQARERTQILFDVANQVRGIVVGTGDLSELALGWCTYNADHMANYGVNVGVPKTLVRHLVRWYARVRADEPTAALLLAVADTVVSPELLPPGEDGSIVQATEDIIGPYELHDFFLWHLLRYGCSTPKIQALAEVAFDGFYDRAVIARWLGVFVERFHRQQFKRTTLPPGPKVGSVAVSPRGDLRMPDEVG